MDRQLPLPAVALEGGADRVVGVEAVAEGARQPAGGRLVAGEAGDGGGHGGHLQRLVKRAGNGYVGHDPEKRYRPVRTDHAL